MNVVALSMFSTSSLYLDRYCQQVGDLAKRLGSQGDSLRLILAEGDSKDDTYAQLRAREQAWPDSVLLKCDHGNEVYGSIEHPQRFAQLSRIWNEMIGHVRLNDDLALIVESDLIWETETVMDLLAYACHRRAIVAPMVMHQKNPGLYSGPGPFFYDRWGFAAHGEQFTNEPPYHPELGDEMLELDSAGSCMAMPAQVLFEGARTTAESELVGFCQQARAKDWRIYLAPQLEIQHP